MAGRTWTYFYVDFSQYRDAKTRLVLLRALQQVALENRPMRGQLLSVKSRYAGRHPGKERGDGVAFKENSPQATESARPQVESVAGIIPATQNWPPDGVRASLQTFTSVWKGVLSHEGTSIKRVRSRTASPLALS
jgi:hypothetical protein